MNESYLIEQNQYLWSLKTPFHVKSDFYSRDAFVQGRSSLSDVEINQMGDVNGLSLLHLQCHFGMDTLSWVRRGAVAVGLDFSPEAIDEAKILAKEAGLSCEFRCDDVLNRQVDWRGSFDRIVTSYGVLCWLPRLTDWAENIAYYLKPGGFFSLLEFHPITNLFSREFSPSGIYSNQLTPISRHRSGTYANRQAPIEYTEHVWGHNISEIVTALLKSGLTLHSIDEYISSPISFHPDMTQSEDGFGLEQGGERLPVLFGITVQKPSE